MDRTYADERITFLTPRREIFGIPEDVTGKGVRIALIDSFFPLHRDLHASGSRRIEWLDVLGKPFDPAPLTKTHPQSWQHGLGKATAIGGTGEVSNGYWCGVAPESDLVLLNYRIIDGQYAGSYDMLLDFLWGNATDLDIRVIVFGNVGDATGPLCPWQWDNQRGCTRDITFRIQENDG